MQESLPLDSLYERLALDPNFYLFNIDLDKDNLEFVETGESALRNSSFHDRRISGFSSCAKMHANIDRIGDALRACPKPHCGINYLFHTAFCCSTLISRCLDLHGLNLSLREPEVLMTLANYRRMRHAAFMESQQWEKLLVLVTRLLGKPFKPEERVLIKPTNAANNLLSDVLQLPTTGKVVLLHSSLERFLISVIRKGEECRAFTRRLFNVLTLDIEQLGIPQRTLMEFTDLQIAALVWHMQVGRYRQTIAAFDRLSLKTLDCDVFLEHPRSMLDRLCTFYGFDVSGQQIDTIIGGPVFNKYSKDGSRSYDAALREVEYAETKRQHARALQAVFKWIRKLVPDGDIVTPLPKAL